MQPTQHKFKLERVYPSTQTEDNTSTVQLNRITPHPRTLRKARENVKHMVADGVSRPKIRSYLFRWLCWWATTSRIWERSELLDWLNKSCWDKASKQIAKEVYQHYFTKLHTTLRSAPAALPLAE